MTGLEIDIIKDKAGRIKCVMTGASEVPFTIIIEDYMESVQKYIDQPHMPEYQALDAKAYIKSLSVEQYQLFMEGFFAWVIESKNNLNIKLSISSWITKNLCCSGIVPEPTTDTFSFSNKILGKKITITGRKDKTGLYQNCWGDRYIVWVEFRDNTVDEYVKFLMESYSLIRNLN